MPAASPGTKHPHHCAHAVPRTPRVPHPPCQAEHGPPNRTPVRRLGLGLPPPLTLPDLRDCSQGTAQPPLTPAGPGVPRIHLCPQPESPAPTAGRHPRPEPGAPARPSGSPAQGPPRRDLQHALPRWRWTPSRNPTPHFSSKKAPAARSPGTQKLWPGVRAPARSCRRRPAPGSAATSPVVPSGSVAGGERWAGRPADTPGSVPRTPPTRLGARRGAGKWPAGLRPPARAESGGRAPGSPGHRRSGTRRAARACPGVGAGRLVQPRRSPERSGAGRPGGPSASGARGAPAPQLRADSGRPPGPGPRRGPAARYSLQ